ncbi:MAG: HlyD family efflux transporter periplasmic adaptor subunit [bacterium]|nr:HlyD family efflux transporter periplasmic adaptor subunit [bacterium]
MAVLAATHVPGITQALEYATISAPVRDARVEQLHVVLGNRVEAGDLLVALDNRVQIIDADRRKLIWKDKAKLRAARLREQLLMERARAMQTLFDNDRSISEEAYDEAVLEHRLAVEERKRLETAEEREQLEYELAVSQLERYLLRAPIAGTVTRIHRRKGESCDLNDPLIELVDVSRGVFVARMEESDGRRLSVAQNVKLALQAGLDELVLQGRVVYLSPVVDPASGLMEVRVEFDNSAGQVRLGGAGVMRLP